MPGLSFELHNGAPRSPEVEEALRRLMALGLVEESGGAYRLDASICPLSAPGRTRGALGPGEHAAPPTGAPAGWGIWPPPSRPREDSWAGLSGPGPGGRQLSQPCPSARRGCVFLKRGVCSHLTNRFHWFHT
jgi:hypothetical protein